LITVAAADDTDRSGELRDNDRCDARVACQRRAARQQQACYRHYDDVFEARLTTLISHQLNLARPELRRNIEIAT